MPWFQAVMNFLKTNTSLVASAAPFITKEPAALYGCHPEFRKRIIKLLDLCVENQLRVEIHQAFRSFKDQQKLYNQGRTTKGQIVTKARAGQSWHNYGVACDIVFLVNGKIVGGANGSWAEKWKWDLLGDLGKRCGLEWGGDWEFKDRPHFQLPEQIKISEAISIHRLGGLEAVWKAIDAKLYRGK